MHGVIKQENACTMNTMRTITLLANEQFVFALQHKENHTYAAVRIIVACVQPCLTNVHF